MFCSNDIGKREKKFLKSHDGLLSCQPTQPGGPNWLCWLAGGSKVYRWISKFFLLLLHTSLEQNIFFSGICFSEGI